MKKSLHYIIIVTIVLATAIFFPTHQAKAQIDRSLNFLPSVPQGRNVNPAFIPEYRFYVGVPLLSSIKTGFENSINYEDVFLRKGDSLLLDRNHILSNIDDKSNINISLMEESVSFGFRADKNYFHFRIADIIETNIVINKELMRFFLFGNGSPEFLGQNVDIGGEVFNVNYYREYSLGYSREVNEKLNLGVNLKYLQGIANITFEKTDIELYTDPADFSMSMRSNVEINISAPGIDDSDVEAGQFLPNTKNKGFAFDIGGQYKINEKITAFASLLNIGSIKWTENLKNFKTENPDMEFSYDGFDIGEYFENNEFDNNRVETILDSIVDELGIIETAQSYKSKLVPMLNMGAHYYLTENNEFSLLIRNKFLKNTNWTNASLAYTRKFGKNINLSFSNTFFKDSFFNPGVAFAANVGPLQLYLINENMIAPFMLDNSNIFVIRFGINLIFNEKGEQLIEGEELL